MTHPPPAAATLSASLSEPDPTGWLGELSLDFSVRDGRTLLSRRRHRGPFTVQRPFYPEDGLPHVYLLHPPGGVVGGDRLYLNVTLAAGSRVLLTMPGATKFYRSAGVLPWEPTARWSGCRREIFSFPERG